MPRTAKRITRRQRLRNRRYTSEGEGIIAYMYSNVSGTRPISKNGPAFLVLGSFSNVGELVGHINRVYGKGGPQCTILQTPKNTFVPLLSPKESMVQYPVQRAAIHTKALISLYTSRRQREKKEFQNAREEKRPGVVNKSSRDVQKRMQRLQDIGLDTIPEKASDKNDAKKQSNAEDSDTALTVNSDPSAEDENTPPTATSESENAKAQTTPTSPPAAPKNVVPPLSTNVKLANQNFAVVSIIHDERKGRVSPTDKEKDENEKNRAPLEPIVSFLGTFDTQKEAENYAKKANSKEVPGAPLFVVQMYSWLFTEAISMESVPVAYPEQPMLEQLINNHQKVQEQGEDEYMRSIEEENEGEDGDEEKSTAEAKQTKAPMKTLDAKQPLASTTSQGAPDEKVPPTGRVKSVIRGANLNSNTDGEEELDMERAISNDCVLNILKSRVLKKNNSANTDKPGLALQSPRINPPLSPPSN